MGKRLFIVAGEASGDMHASHLISHLLIQEPSWKIEGLGGSLMQKAGCYLHFNLVGKGVMGISELFGHYLMLRKLFHRTLQNLLKEPPSALVLVDYPEFNLTLAKAVKKQLSIPIIYYISPQVWAWRRGRIKKIARVVDKMLVILPFEEPLYRDRGVDALYVGHPVIDSLASYNGNGELREHLSLQPGERVVGLLPGSRPEVVRRMLPVMLRCSEALAQKVKGLRFAVPCIDESMVSLAKTITDSTPLALSLVKGMTYQVMDLASLCLVTSGTATLETACFLTPMLVLYKTSAFNYLIGRPLVKVPFFSLVNLLAQKEVVPEHLQNQIHYETIASQAAEILLSSSRSEQMKQELGKVRDLLGPPGASERAARAIIEYLSE